MRSSLALAALRPLATMRSPIASSGMSRTLRSGRAPVAAVGARAGVHRRDDEASPWPAWRHVGRRPRYAGTVPGGGDGMIRGSALGVTHASRLSEPLPSDLESWTEYADPNASADVGTISSTSRIFCNRSLNMGTISAVGFDMDYTLAMYKPETFEGEGPWRRVLAYDETCKKLVGVYGYPEEILDFQYDHTYMVRGLVVDKRRGNILKMDRHKYVKVAHHGFRPLAGRLFLARRFLLRCRASLRSPRASRSKKSPCSASKPRGACRPYRSASEKRLATYCDTAKVDQFDGADYANVDTLFSLGETYLFCQLVELKEKAMEQDPDSMIARKSFYDMYNEIRASVDLCHRDGSLKRAVALDPAKYIHRDDALVPMLRALRASGKKTFLLTNSLWDFTNVVMNYLVADAKGEKKTTEWMELFDAVITGSCKPGFFENERAGIFAVDVDSGTLHNTDDGAPMTPIGASKAASAADDAMGRLGSDGTKAYQGGSYRHLHAMLGISSGNKVLYVGDHIYGDILRSKKTLGWRTMLVVPELAHEMECLEKAEEAKIPARLRQLQQRRDRLADALQLAAWRREKLGGEQVVGKDYEVLLAKADSAREEHRQEMRELHAGFHRVWGQMMKAGNQNSRFAHQLERYACLYTSHARNLVAYSPAKSYRGLSDSMPHDLYQDE